MLLASLLKSLVVKYWLILAGQLSFLAVFGMCLVSFYSGVISPSDLEIIENEILLNKVVPIEFEMGNQSDVVLIEDNEVANGSEMNNVVSATENHQVSSIETASHNSNRLGISEIQSIPNENIAIELVLNKLLEFSNVIVWIWCVGLLIMTTRWCLGAYGLLILKRSGRRAPQEVNAVFSDLRQRFTKGKAKLMESASIVSPMVVGVLKPVVYIPCGLMTRMAPDQVEALLLHELAHIRRFDYFWNLLQRLSEVLFFFNPVMWWAGKVVRQLREEICDDFVVTETQKPKRYAQALYTLEETRGEWLAIRATGAGASLRQRFETLLGQRKVRFNPLPSFSGLIMMLILGLIGLTPIATVDAKNENVVSDPIPQTMECEPLFGRVVDIEGNPVSGAKVMLYYGKPTTFDPRAGIVEEVKSDDKGNYAFKRKRIYRDQGYKKIWGDHYSVIVKHPDWAVSWRKSTTPEILAKDIPKQGELVVTLQKPMSQSFTVMMVGDEDGDYVPLEGAKVHLSFLYSNAEEANESIYIGNDLGLSSGFSNAEGKVTLNGLPPNKCSFVISHKNTGRSWKTKKHNQNNDLHTRCYPAAGVTGRVLKPDGEGVANVLLKIKRVDSWNPWFVSTDENGNYSIGDLYGEGNNAATNKGKGKAEYNISVVSDEWLSEEISFKLKPKEFREIENIKVSKGQILKVYTTNFKNGEPLPFARVRVDLNGNSKYVYSDATGIVKINTLPGEQHFYMHDAPKGFYQSHRLREGYGYATVNVLEGVTSQAVRLSLDVKPTRTINGFITSPNGSDLFKGKVKLRYKVVYPPTTNTFIVDSGTRKFWINGKLEKIEGNRRFFTLEGVPADLDCLVHAQDIKSGVVGIGKLKGSQLEFELQLEKETSQRVKLTDSHGKLLKGQRIHYGEYMNGEITRYDSLKTDLKGEVLLSNLRRNAKHFIHLAKNANKKTTFELKQGEVQHLKLSEWIDTAVLDEKGHPLQVEKVTSQGIEFVDGSVIFLTAGKGLKKDGNGFWKLHKNAVAYLLNHSTNKIMIRVLLRDGSQKTIYSTKISNSGNIKFQIKGVIVNKEGKPIKGARIIKDERYRPLLDGEKQLQSYRTFRKKDTITFTADDGLFVVPSSKRDSSHLRIDADGYATRWIFEQALSGETNKIILQNTTLCEGVIRDFKGDPVSNELIYLTTERSIDNWSTDGERISNTTIPNLIVSLKTDNRGRFSQFLEPGKWHMKSLIANGHLIDESFTIKLNEKLKITPKLQDPINLVVSMRDIKTKEVIKTPEVVLRSEAGQEVKLIKEQENGDLIFSGMMPGKYSLSYTEDDLRTPKYVAMQIVGEGKQYYRGLSTYFNLSSGSHRKEILLVPGVLVKGKVSSNLINNFKNITISVVSFKNQKFSNSITSFRCKSDGSFSNYVALDPDQKYCLIAYEATNINNRIFAQAISEPFTGEPEQINMELKKGGVIKGRLLDESNKPIERASITIEGMDIERSGLTESRTDKNGYFIYTGVPAGEFKLIVKKDIHSFEGGLKKINLKENQVLDIGEFTINNWKE